LDIRNDDTTQLDNTLSTQLVYPIAMLNELFDEHRCPAFVSDTQEPDDLALFGDAIPKLVQAGAKIPVFYVNRKLKIPEPAEGEEILAVSNHAETAQDDESAQNNVAAMAKLFPLITAYKKAEALSSKTTQADDIDPTPVTAMTQLLAKDAGPVLNQWLTQLSKQVDESESLDALQQSLIESYGHLQSDDLVQVMTIAFAAADLSGRYDVQGGH
jgi:phage gp29-like protein